jgi:hypothetical protein
MMRLRSRESKRLGSDSKADLIARRDLIRIRRQAMGSLLLMPSHLRYFLIVFMHAEPIPRPPGARRPRLQLAE